MFRGFIDDPFFGFNEHPHREIYYNQLERSSSQRDAGNGRNPSIEGPSRYGMDVALPGFFDHSMFSSPMNSLMGVRDSSSMFDFMMPSFGNMMDRAFSESTNISNQDGFGYSSVSVASYVNDGSGQPKIFEASRSTKHAPGGIQETHKALRDSEVGVEKMAIGHHIRDRGHVITRERNTRNGDMRENQDFHGFAEEEAGQFDQEWQRQTNNYGGRSQHFLKDSRAPIRPKIAYKANPKSKH